MLLPITVIYSTTNVYTVLLPKHKLCLEAEVFEEIHLSSFPSEYPGSKISFRAIVLPPKKVLGRGVIVYGGP